ncbi:ankyrin repeat-containing domain protein [Aspergillus taichungensis]|uniref:Ankyrin repeat-containing domain protein n=1 Tax=Aspergillus taichungensis TaxID=482145 RepID=A0A2J5I0K8_9EURO|nr:ankyrin repeat-containing domain protein [Aspergillus taichungensis]
MTVILEHHLGIPCCIPPQPRCHDSLPRCLLPAALLTNLFSSSVYTLTKRFLFTIENSASTATVMNMASEISAPMSALPPGKSQLSSVEDLVAALRDGHNEEDILMSLIERNKDTIDLLVNGRTVLSYAVESLYPNCVRVLLHYSHPNTVDQPDATGRTALSYAATAEVKQNIFPSSRRVGWVYKPYSSWKEIVKLLIAENADPRSRDYTGRTPLSWAAGMGCNNTVDFFCNAYKDDDGVFAADHGGRSPVSYAAQAGHYVVIRKLFSAKENYDDCDHENRTPLYWCLQKRWKDDRFKDKPISGDATMYSCLPPSFHPVFQGAMPPKPNDQHIVKVLNQSVKGKMTLLSEAVMHDDEYAVEALMRIPHFTCDAINEEGGETALILALRYNKKSIFGLLCDNLGESLEQINRHPSHETLFQRFLEVGRSCFDYKSSIGHRGLFRREQFLRASLEYLLHYKEIEKVEQLLGNLIDTLRVPPIELEWVISSGSSLREAVANLKQISLIHVLLAHGINPAILCLRGRWFDLRPSEARGSLQLWQLPEPEKYSDYRTPMQEYIERMKDEMPKTYGIKIRTTDEIEHIECCENSKTTILYQHPLIILL